MLCRRCSETVPEARARQREAPGVGVATGVWCARCGTAIGPPNLTERLIAKLAQLAQFGLAGRDGVLRPTVRPRDS